MRRILVGFLLVLVISFSISFLPEAKAEKETKKEEYNILIKSSILIDNATNKATFFRKNLKTIIVYEKR